VIIYFCSIIANIIIGITAIAAAADIGPQRMPRWAQKLDTPTVTVIALLRVNKNANKNSFQEYNRQNTVVTANPGAASGRTIRRKTAKRE
jgi:hypothetical protein